jgi:hypothetical protein
MLTVARLSSSRACRTRRPMRSRHQGVLVIFMSVTSASTCRATATCCANRACNAHSMCHTTCDAGGLPCMPVAPYRTPAACRCDMTTATRAIMCLEMDSAS